MKEQFSFLDTSKNNMILSIYVKPNSKKEQIIVDNDSFTLYITESPVEGKANKIILKILSKFFNIPITNIEIIKGNKSHDKKLSLNELTENQKQQILKIIQDYKNSKK